ncbi:hypothetical protein [Parvularcula dongshanensis]|uniref:Uncharacterized protein n=1 Tax=Parvularcula dongshanensis TaxID=1173995 RepID=A0A840I066_9PROT|nr:hypothetical protein [Parvularcula dongshanensis]MBB4658087.1 hypothetical protein [Parvularcula dongshanensis]
MITTLVLGTLCAPNLGRSAFSWPLGLAALLACALAAADERVPLVLTLLAASMAGTARSLRAESAVSFVWSGLAAWGGLAVLWLLVP